MLYVKEVNYLETELNVLLKHKLDGCRDRVRLIELKGPVIWSK